ncbi:MAG: WD40 repeat domain-containing protein, partial [Prevotellaceae bacterium]|nr:WD40 repeat domain-containing protein [Prevotellaceae bacterium]
MNTASTSTPILLRKHTLLLVAALFVSISLTAQIEVKKSIATKLPIVAFDNTTYCMAFLSNGALYTFRDAGIVNTSDITQLVMNPTGSSIAVIRKKKPVYIYSFREANKELFTLKERRKGLKAKPLPLAMCYGADARNLLVSNTLGEIVVYDTREYLPQAYIQSKAPVTRLALSSNNYFIAAGYDSNIDIWNFQTKELRRSIPMEGEIRAVTFSPDASLMASVTGDNLLTIFDTKTWEPVERIDSLGGVLSSPSFHPDSKYISIVRDNKEILVYNLKNRAVEQVMDEGANVRSSRFFKDNQSSDVFMLSNRTLTLVFWDANGLNPFFGKLLSKEVDAKMNDWVKMMQGESMEDYAIRVNDETRMKQQQLFAQEVATELAGSRVSLDNPFVGEYDASSNKLNIGFNSIAAIELEVPAAEAGSFSDKDLKFENAVYVLNDKDEFELAYVEVRNETTNKVYIYDNIGRTKLTALEDDANFVPLEVIQQAQAEEAQLKDIKETVVEENKQEKLITENTQINVHTEVQPGVDANGNKILNYKVSYQYEVINKQFSAKEDFPSGGYNIERSNAAMSLMKIIKSAFEGDFAKYLQEGKQVKIIITGSADASPITGRIAYNGQYGEFVDEPYYKNGNLDNITVTKATGITSNEQLALMRAAGVKDYIEKNVTTLEKTGNDY